MAVKDEFGRYYHPGTLRPLNRRQRVREAREAIHRGARRRRLMRMEPMLRRQAQMHMMSPLGDREKLMLQQALKEKMFGLEQGGREDIAMMNLQGRGQLAERGYDVDREMAQEAHRRELLKGDIGHQQTMARAEHAAGLPKQFAPEVFQGPGGDQQWITPGQPIGQGYQQVRPTGVEVNIGPTTAPSPSERTDIRDARASIDALNNLNTLQKDSYVGPISGRTAPIKGTLGMTGIQQEAFMAATAAFKNAIIKQITGAQMSEQEAARILQQVPLPTDPPKRWRAKWEQSKQNVEFMLQRQMEILRQSNIIEPGVTPVGGQPQQADPLGIR